LSQQNNIGTMVAVHYAWAAHVLIAHLGETLIFFRLRTP
jgi:hypothetical protein